MTTRLLRVRHAPVAVHGVCYGRADVELAFDPDEACSAVIRQLDALSVIDGVTGIATSPSRRTRLLAEALASALGLPLRVDERLAELSFGEWELRTWDAIEADDGPRLRAWMARWRHEAPPGGERVDALLARVSAFVASLDEACCLAVTHAGVMRALRARDRGIDYADVVGEPVPHLTVEGG